MQTQLSKLAVSERSEAQHWSSEWADRPPRRRKTVQMDSNGAGSVQYDRWNEDNINMNVEASQSSLQMWDLADSGWGDTTRGLN